MVQQMNTPLKTCTSNSGLVESSAVAVVGPWKCNVCQEKFTDPKAHVDHMGSHSKEYPSSCQLCLSRFKNTTELSNHKVTDCAAHTRNKVRNHLSITTNNSAPSVKPIPPKDDVMPPILRDETQRVNNNIGPYSNNPPSIVDDDYEVAISRNGDPALKSWPSLSEANNNISKSDFLIVDPWLACATLVNPIEMKDFEEINEAVVVENMTMNNSNNNNTGVPKKKHGKNQRNASLDADVHKGRKLSTGSSQNSTQSLPSSPMDDDDDDILARLPSGASLVDGFQNIVVNNCEINVDEPTNGNTIRYSTPDLKCVRCKLTFANSMEWSQHLTKVHMSAARSGSPMVSLEKFDAADLHGSFLVTNDENGKLSIVPKPVPQLDLSESVEKGPNVAEQCRDGLKFTIIRNGVEGYALKRKSTDSTDDYINDRSQLDSLSPGTDFEGTTTELPTPTISPENINEKSLDEAVEESRNKAASTPAAVHPAKGTGESNMGKFTTTTLRMGFQPRFIRTKQTPTKPKIQVVGSGEPVTRILTNEETRPAVSAGPDKSTVTPAPSTPVISEPLPDLVSQERVANTITDENDNHRNTANSKSPAPSESRGTPEPKQPTEKESTSEQSSSSSSQKLTVVSSDLTSSNVTAPNKDLVETNAEPPAEASSEQSSQISPSPQPPQTSNDVDSSSTEPVSDDQRSESNTGVDEEDDDDGALMIDVPGDFEPSTANNNSSVNGEEGVSVQQTNKEGGKDDTTPATSASLPENVESSDNNNPDNDDNDDEKRTEDDADDDFQCRVCKEMFTCDEELETHFSAEHFRPATDILEPESPFPTFITVHGTSSSIFEDEVEESEPMSVEAMVAQNTLHSLLRRNSTEESRVVNPSAAVAPIRNPSQVQNRMAIPYGGIRPIMPGRCLPNARPQLQMVPPGTTMAPIRPGMRPPPNMAPGPGQRGPVPYRASSYPYTLHQALANPQAQGPPPPRPQLRPMPGAHMQGGPRVQAPQPQTRPPLTRVPPPQMGGPPNATATQQQQQQQQQSSLMSPPMSTHHRELTNRIQQHRQSIQQYLQTIRRLDDALASDLDPHSRNQCENEKDRFTQAFHSTQAKLQNDAAQLQQLELRHQQQQQQQQAQQQSQQQQMQRQHHQIQQQMSQQHQQMSQQQQQMSQSHQQMQQRHQQQQQQQLQRQQQIHPMQLQHQHQQQLRQIQQQRLQNSGEVRNHSVNANGKRPTIEFFDVSHANRAKQARIDFGQPEETTITEVVNNDAPNENRQLRIPNGLTLSVVPQSSDSASPPTQVAPGAHSGSSSGSMHSSRTVSPAMASPGTVATKLTSNGITLTPASPSPISPPPNPILSPISDCSPRGSPRIPGSSVIQRAANVVSPAASAGSGSPSPRANTSSPQQNTNFAVPRAPVPAVRANHAIGINPNAERPDRPPTIDLTDDEVQSHNAAMRATGGGAVTEQQLQHYEAHQRRVATGIPGNSQYSNQQSPSQLKSTPCPVCNVFFGSIEVMNEHKLKFHSQVVQHQPNNPLQQQQFRHPNGPQLATRRQSPQSASILNPSILRGGAPIRGPARLPPSPNNNQMMQIRSPNNTPMRPHETTTQMPRSSGENASDTFVLPLINLSRLEQDPARKLALISLGVESILPITGITRLGIPIMRIRPDILLGHFPHDSALEVGSVQTFDSALRGVHTVTTTTASPPTNNNNNNNNVSPGVARPQAGSSNMNCCPDNNNQEHHHPQMQRHVPNLNNNNPAASNNNHVHGNGPVATNNNMVANNNNNNQYHQSIRDSVVGNHGQLIVTPISRQ